MSMVPSVLLAEQINTRSPNCEWSGPHTLTSRVEKNALLFVTNRPSACTTAHLQNKLLFQRHRPHTRGPTRCIPLAVRSASDVIIMRAANWPTLGDITAVGGVVGRARSKFPFSRQQHKTSIAANKINMHIIKHITGPVKISVHDNWQQWN